MLIKKASRWLFKIPFRSIKECLKIIEEMEDIKAYKKAKSEWLSFEEAFAEIEKMNKLQNVQAFSKNYKEFHS